MTTLRLSALSYTAARTTGIMHTALTNAVAQMPLLFQTQEPMPVDAWSAAMACRLGFTSVLLGEAFLCARLALEHWSLASVGDVRSGFHPILIFSPRSMSSATSRRVCLARRPFPSPGRVAVVYA